MAEGGGDVDRGARSPCHDIASVLQGGVRLSPEMRRKLTHDDAAALYGLTGARAAFRRLTFPRQRP